MRIKAEYTFERNICENYVFLFFKKKKILSRLVDVMYY